MLLGYMVYLLTAEALLLPKLDGGDVGELLRFSQDWVMYSPQPPLDGGWWAVRGAWSNGTAEERVVVDMLRGLRDGVWVEEATGGGEEGEQQQVEVPSLLYRSWRWERYLTNMGKMAGRRAWLPREGSGSRSFGEGGSGGGALRGRRGCAAGNNAEATERLEWLAAYLCARWAASGRVGDTPHPARRGGGAVLELDWLYVRRLPPPGASTALIPTRTRELTYEC